MKLPIILASQSPARLELLKQIGVVPDKIIPSDIDETEKKGENARSLALRLAKEKALAIANSTDNAIIIAADTVPVCGGKIMRKASSPQDVKESIAKLSGRRHQVFTGICIIKKDDTGIKIANKVVKTIIKFRVITQKEIDFYADLGQGEAKAGGYTLTGYAESFVSFISGSFSNVIGLPLHDTINILNSFGVYPYKKID